ncbi:MAG: ABC transporter substrate-binding protein [Magnetococcales bacterium]|nr:ABC transporter substrate-binding protein [Magnetococcales bacterium]
MNIECKDDQVRIVSLFDVGYATIVTRHAMFLADLRGQKIGYPHGSAAHFTLLKALAIARLTPDDARLVPMNVHAMPTALQQGYVHAYVAWEPTTTLSIHQGQGWPLFRSLMTGYLYFSPDLAQRDPQVVKSFLASQVRALNWLLESEWHLRLAVSWAIQSARDFLPDVSLPSQDGLEMIALRGIRRLGALPIVDENELTKEGHLGQVFDFLQSMGGLPNTFTWDAVRACFDSKTLLHVLADPVGNRLQNFSYQGVISP